MVQLVVVQQLSRRVEAVQGAARADLVRLVALRHGDLLSCAHTAPRVDQSSACCRDPCWQGWQITLRLRLLGLAIARTGDIE